MKAADPQPGSRSPAPAPLDFVQEFVNTNDREGGVDAFSTPAEVAAWFRGAGLEVGLLRPTDLARTVRLREAIRQLALYNNDGPPAPEAAALLGKECRRCGSLIVFDPPRVALLATGSDLDRALGKIVSSVFDSFARGDWIRFKACRRDVCQWVFFDRSRNRSGTWCAMEVCGNRVKTHAYWSRRTSRRT